MEFLLFLTSKEKEILELIYKAGFTVEENTPLCLLGKQFFGFVKAKQKKLVICTKNAMELGGYLLPRGPADDDFSMTRIYIRRALRHEATHIAQSCNGGKALGLREGKKIKLHPYKMNALKGSIRISGNREKEIEAYWLEDRPRLVIKALKKYCL